MQTKKAAKTKLTIRRSIVVFAITLSVISSVVLFNWHLLKSNQQIENLRRFELDASAIVQSLHERMHAYEMVLRGLASSFVNKPEAVTYNDWQNIVAQLHIADLYPGISSLVWSRYLTKDELSAFVAQNQQDRPNFKITPSGTRDDYQIIQYIGPLNATTGRVIGLDILTQYPQNQTQQHAVNTGGAVLSLPLNLYVSSDGEDLIGALMYFPVYPSGKVPDALDERKSQLIGVTNAAFRGQELVEGIFGEQLRLFHLRATDIEVPNIAIFDSKAVHQYQILNNWQPKFSKQIKLQLYGRTWLLEVNGTPEYEKSLLLSSKYNLPLFLGLTIAFLMAFLAAFFVHLRERKMYASEKLARKLHKQAQELTLANRYKSEFLANMSHELRTPLNSILILSDQLRQNSEHNLNDKQAKHADIIYKAGNDLLQLINDVLDLAKIEAGRIQINLEPLNLQNLLLDLDAAMRPQAEAKNLKLSIASIANNDEIPQQITTDRIRLHQILRNLLSNAIKFTDEGEVKLGVKLGFKQKNGRINLIFNIEDSGIGIDAKYHQQIFTAFTQVDGSTRRRFGGTGLGLPITKQLVHALGGTIELSSKLGHGTTFIVQIPVKVIERNVAAHNNVIKRSGSGAKLLIVEDDPNFASIIIEQASNNGFASVHCANGASALQLLADEQFVAIILDILLPDISGWQLFAHLRTMPQYQATPVQIISCLPCPQNVSDEPSTYYLTKPINRESLAQVFTNLQLDPHPVNGTNLLLIEDVEHERAHYQQHLSALGFKVTAVENAKNAQQAWQNSKFNFLVIDLNLPDLDGFSLLKSLDNLRSLSNTHIVINTGVDLDLSGLQQLRNYSAVVVNKNGSNLDALNNAVQSFLGNLNAPNLPNANNASFLVDYLDMASSLCGKRILLVDDDIRNVYAMSALLDSFGLQISVASNGEEAIKAYLTGELDLILMDMSMPVMDGYTATNLLKTEHNCSIPIIALTAHAMKGDRQKCLDAGADDYIAKPVQSAALQQILEYWLISVANQA